MGGEEPQYLHIVKTKSWEGGRLLPPLHGAGQAAQRPGWGSEGKPAMHIATSTFPTLTLSAFALRASVDRSVNPQSQRLTNGQSATGWLHGESLHAEIRGGGI